MPKDTFFRLDEAKRRKIMEAARREFSDVPLHEASIANIVKYAEIPRGSFYQYFTDKEDLFFYYFDSVHKETEDSLQRLLREEKGNLFSTFQKYAEVLLNDILHGPNSDFLRNFFYHMNYSRTNRIAPFTDEQLKKTERPHRFHHAHQSNHQTLLENVDTGNLNITTKRELEVLIRLILSMFLSTINYALKCQKEGQPVEVSEMLVTFNMKLNWLRHGVEKNKEGEAI